MIPSTIALPVDSETAQAFAKSPPAEQRKIQLLLALRPQELTQSPTRPLKLVMDEIGHQAVQRGLTLEMLESLLNAR